MQRVADLPERRLAECVVGRRDEGESQQGKQGERQQEVRRADGRGDSRPAAGGPLGTAQQPADQLGDVPAPAQVPNGGGRYRLSVPDMELGHWVTGSMGHLGHLSRPGHRVIILTRCETRVFPVFEKNAQMQNVHLKW